MKDSWKTNRKTAVKNRDLWELLLVKQRGIKDERFDYCTDSILIGEVFWCFAVPLCGRRR